MGGRGASSGGTSGAGARQSLIEKNEYNEILFKASVKDKDTGKRIVGFEFSSPSLKQAREDLIKNGYSVTPRTILPRKMFDNVMEKTNGNVWDWEDAQKEFKKILKEKGE